jgi:heptosyltransferase-2
MQGLKKILVINLGGVGDFLLSTPALRALRKKFPEAVLALLVTKRIDELAKDISCINEVFAFHVGYGGMMPAGKLFINLITLLKLRLRHFDMAVNMRTLETDKGAENIRRLLGVIRPKKTAGRNTDGRGSFFDISIPETLRGQKHEMEHDLDMAKALGAQRDDETIDLPVDEASHHKVRRLLESEGIDSNTILVGIHPGGMPSRRWPLENFARAIEEIRAKISCRFVITGSGSEAELANRLKAVDPALVADLCGRLTLKELGALISRCHLYISNDTGPMHMAASLKVPLVAIFGPGKMAYFDPRYISEKAVVLFKGAECAPCEKVACDDLKCLKAVMPDEVVRAALNSLESIQKRGR